MSTLRKMGTRVLSSTNKENIIIHSECAHMPKITHSVGFLHLLVPLKFPLLIEWNLILSQCGQLRRQPITPALYLHLRN